MFSNGGEGAVRPSMNRSCSARLVLVVLMLLMIPLCDSAFGNKTYYFQFILLWAILMRA